MRRDISLKTFYITCLLLFLLKVWLTRAYHVMVTVTPHDDLHFIKNAAAILGGSWLGEFNQMTLIKEPFYPLFIAISHWLSLPLLFSQQLLQGFSCWIFVVAVRPMVEKRYLLLAAFAILLCNPGSFSYPAVGRIFQLSIYASLATIVLSTLLGMAIRVKQQQKNGLAWSAGLGCAFSIFWITRGESIFIVPSLGIVFFALLIVSGVKDKRSFGRIFLLCALPFAMSATTVFIVQQINNHYYGVPSVIEITSKEFESAYGGLLRIKSDDEKRFYPVVRNARQQAYAVSPTFREIEKYMDGPVGAKWQNLIGDVEIPAAFFIWAFRDSVAAAGFYKDGATALTFYRKMGEEIDAACDSGKLDCRQRSTSLVPPWREEYNTLVVPTVYDVMKKTLTFDMFNASAAPFRSTAPKDILTLFSVVTGETILSGYPSGFEGYPDFYPHFNKEKTRILGQIGWLYRHVVPYLFVVAFVVFLLNLVRCWRQRELSLLTVFSVSTLSGIAGITAVMTLLTITSYSEIARVMHVSYPIVLLFIVSVFFDAFTNNQKVSNG